MYPNRQQFTQKLSRERIKKSNCRKACNYFSVLHCHLSVACSKCTYMRWIKMLQNKVSRGEAICCPLIAFGREHSLLCCPLSNTVKQRFYKQSFTEQYIQILPILNFWNPQQQRYNSALQNRTSGIYLRCLSLCGSRYTLKNCTLFYLSAWTRDTKINIQVYWPRY